MLVKKKKRERKECGKQNPHSLVWYRLKVYTCTINGPKMGPQELAIRDLNKLYEPTKFVALMFGYGITDLQQLVWGLARLKSPGRWPRGPLITPPIHRFIIRSPSQPPMSAAPPPQPLRTKEYIPGETVSRDLLLGSLILREFFSSLPHCKN